MLVAGCYNKKRSEADLLCMNYAFSLVNINESV